MGVTAAGAKQVHHFRKDGARAPQVGAAKADSPPLWHNIVGAAVGGVAGLVLGGLVALAAHSSTNSTRIAVAAYAGSVAGAGYLGWQLPNRLHEASQTLSGQPLSSE